MTLKNEGRLSASCHGNHEGACIIMPVLLGLNAVNAMNIAVQH